jgi:hypothetical protein
METSMTKNLYSSVMLPMISYCNLDEEFSSEITRLEYDTMKNLSDFFENVKDCLLLQNMALTPEIMIAHLSAYLGVLAATCLTETEFKKLKPEIIPFLTKQAKLSYDTFSKYPVNSTDSPDKINQNLETLRENSPGSLTVQTIRLGRSLKDNLDELIRNRVCRVRHEHLKQEEWFCPLDDFTHLVKQAVIQTRQDADLPLSYVVNQMTIQLGWLMGYYGHLDQKFPKSYLEFGAGCLDLYMERGHKLWTHLL